MNGQRDVFKYELSWFMTIRVKNTVVPKKKVYPKYGTFPLLQSSSFERNKVTNPGTPDVYNLKY